MFRFSRNNETAFQGQEVHTRWRLGLVAGLMLALSLLVAACGSTAESSALPTAESSALPTAEPTALPTAEPTALPTDEPTALPTAESASLPAATDTPVAGAMITPSVLVSDQEVLDGKVTIAEVVSDGPGWLVIHAQADRTPGPILGYSPVADATNADVIVAIDAANATETLYVMLHTDAGELGTWEFPDGPDAPVRVGEQLIAPAFTIIGGLPAAEVAITPSVTVADQALMDGKVTIGEVVSDGPGWLVVHAEADGKPGPILGYSQVSSGASSDVTVRLDLSAAPATLYAMLHTDAGTIGTWEFPGGPDTPVMVSDQIVSPAFQLQVPFDDEAEVEIEDFEFNPKVLVIRAGTTVKFANKDEAQHTATSDEGVWDSGYLAKGEEFFFTFAEPGVYPYYCIPHGGPGGQGMAATITVLK